MPKKRVKIKGLETWYNLADPKRDNAPHESGLYLVGCAHYNPTFKAPMYVIKVGKATWLDERMSAYASTNPLLYHIDFLPKPKKELGMWEELYQRLLAHKCQYVVEKTTEWFLIDEPTYLSICTSGFGAILDENN